MINDKEKVIFYIKKDPKHNRLKNLKLTTVNDILKEVHNDEQSIKPAPVKAYNYDANEMTYHKSMNSASEKLNVNRSLIKSVYDKKIWS